MLAPFPAAGSGRWRARDDTGPTPHFGRSNRWPLKAAEPARQLRRDGRFGRPGRFVHHVESLGGEPLDPDGRAQQPEVLVRRPDVGSLLMSHSVGPSDDLLVRALHDDILSPVEGGMALEGIEPSSLRL